MKYRELQILSGTQIDAFESNSDSYVSLTLHLVCIYLLIRAELYKKIQQKIALYFFLSFENDLSVTKILIPNSDVLCSKKKQYK